MVSAWTLIKLEKINSYCSVSLDKAEICQTTSVQDSDNPFWVSNSSYKLQEYKTSIDGSDFETLRIDIWNKQLSGSKTKYGQLTISRKEMEAGVKGWFSIQPVRPQCTGRVLLLFKYYRPTSANTDHSISVTVMRAIGLSSPYSSSTAPTTQAVLHLIPNLQTHATAIKPNNSNPEFLEYFTL